MAKRKVNTPSEAQLELLRATANSDPVVSQRATHEIAKAFETVLRKGLFAGDIVTDIFEQMNFAPGTAVEFPLDFVAPGTQRDYNAFTIPRHGYIPQRTVEGDYVMIPTYSIANSIDWLLKYARDARWDIVSRAMEVFKAGVVKKINDDGWHVLLAAALDRNVVIYDSDAASGQFTKRLVSLMKTIMTRNGGGNSATNNRAKLTDLYMSPEGIEDIRNWGVDIIDEGTRQKIYNAADGSLGPIFGVNLHEVWELGESAQEYTAFYLNTLGGSLAAGDLELVLGLDLGQNDAFVMPIRQPWETFDDPTLHRHQKAGVYGFQEHGLACLSNQRLILGSY